MRLSGSRGGKRINPSDLHIGDSSPTILMIFRNMHLGKKFKPYKRAENEPFTSSPEATTMPLPSYFQYFNKVKLFTSLLTCALRLFLAFC